jgi:hypothetical protein
MTMTATFEVDLNKQQAAFIRRSLMQTIDSMRSLFIALHRENARWSSPETEAALLTDDLEIAALQHMVDELAKFQKAHGWPEGIGGSS